MTGKGPPPDIAPSELWAALSALPRPAIVVDFPAKDPHGTPVGQVAIRVLTAEELMTCAAQAAKVAKEFCANTTSTDPQLAYDKVYQDACVIEVLARACRDVNAPDYNRPAFPAPKEVRRRLTPDQLTILMQQYLRVERELGPVVSTMTAEEEDAWIRRLAQAGNAFPTASLSRDALERLTLSLALRLHSSSTDTSSAGSPPDDSSPSEKEPPDSPPSSEAPSDEFAAADATLTLDDPPT